MSKFLLVEKAEGVLVPADPWSAEYIDTLKEGVTYKVEIRQDRSKGKLGQYWAGIGLLVENMSDEDRQKWPTSRKYHETMLDALGYTYKLWRVDGTYRTMPDSIAMEAMDEAEFLTLFERVQAITVELFGWNPWDAWKEQKEQARAARQRWWRGR